MALLELNFDQLNILVVDDSRTTRQLLKSTLQDIGVGQVMLAEDGADAIEKMRKFPADVVLCDLHMVPLDGIEFTRIVRSADDSPNPYVPILMMTSDATQEKLKAAMDAGINSFMSKPIKMEGLRRQLIAAFSAPLIFVREGRFLKPLTRGCKPGSAVAPPAASKAAVKAPAKDINKASSKPPPSAAAPRVA